MKKFTLFIAVVLLMSCFTDHSYSSTGYKSTFEETKNYTTYLAVKNNNVDIKLDIIIELKSGSSKIIVIDPNNKNVETFNFKEAGKFEISKNIDSIKGKWSLILESSDAVGSYNLKWSNE